MWLVNSHIIFKAQLRNYSQPLNLTLSPPSLKILPGIYQLTMLDAGQEKINEIKSLPSRNSLGDIFGKKDSDATLRPLNVHFPV